MHVAFLEHVDELGESRGHPYARFVFNAFVALAQHLLDDHGKVVALGLGTGLAKVHEHRDEGGLTVRGHERDDLILDGLDTAADFVAQTVLDDLVHLVGGGLKTQRVDLGKNLATNLLTAHLDERRQMRKRDGLAAVLAAGHLSDDLRGDVTRRAEAVRTLDERAGDDRAVLQHVLEVHEVAVVHMLGEVIRVVEVDDAFFVGLHDVGGKKDAHGKIFRDFACHIVALHGVDRGVLVRVLLLDFFVVAFDQGQNLIVGGVGNALEALHVAIDDIGAGEREIAQGHDFVFDHVLNLFDRNGVARGFAALLHAMRSGKNLLFAQTIIFGNVGIRALYGVDDLRYVEDDLRTAAFDDFHDFTFDPSCDRMRPPLNLPIKKNRPGKEFPWVRDAYDTPFRHNIL